LSLHVSSSTSLAGAKTNRSLPSNLGIALTPSNLYFRADRKMVKVMLQDISYIESMKDYVKVFTSNGTIITKQSISSVETLLPEKNFIRTHRSFIVSLDKIKSFTSELIEISTTEIPVGKLYRNGVMKVLG
jgi:DNA-binding LytR/AlgR family response regulator